VARRKLIAGNWKMNKTPGETEAFIAAFLQSSAATAEPEVLLIPPFTSLDRAARFLEGSSVSLGAQDLHPEAKGAFTGAVSGEMIRASGCTYVLAGHSERRHVFGDTSETVGRKLRAALSAELRPILCVGELIEERRAGTTDDVLSAQLEAGLDGVSKAEMTGVAVAYEPVWAIGTGETATPEQAQETIAEIRRRLAERFGEDTADATRILYGGSVKPENAADLVGQPDIDGALVGGASLDPEAFARIVTEASKGAPA
jgi:triosephosphate isomerase